VLVSLKGWNGNSLLHEGGELYSFAAATRVSASGNVRPVYCAVPKYLSTLLLLWNSLQGKFFVQYIWKLWTHASSDISTLVCCFWLYYSSRTCMAPKSVALYKPVFVITDCSWSVCFLHNLFFLWPVDEICPVFLLHL
jgi:hypothetical protein